MELNSHLGKLSVILSCKYFSKDIKLTVSMFRSSSTDKKVKIWDISSHECIQTFDQHTNQVTGVRYDPNGTRLASVSEDQTIVIYDHLK